MLSELPVEILLGIIQWLPCTTLASLSTLSKQWAALMNANESSIYHGISRRYGYVPKGGSDTTAPPEGWRAWFIRKLQIELRWIGKLPADSHRIRIPGKKGNFHRIKIDEEAGYVINTFTSGGLVVSDIRDHRVLWALDEEFCDPLVHCEYDEGYLVFNRFDNYKEVWRRRIDVLEIPSETWPSEPHNKPDVLMVEAYFTARDKYLDDSRDGDPDHIRGHFVPWARLLIPEDPEEDLAFQLTRGTLLVCSLYQAFLFDVEKAELQQTIGVHALGFGELRYVDLSEDHVFMAGTLQLNIYDRASGSRVLSIPSGRLPWGFYADPANQWRRAEGTSDYGELNFRRAEPTNWAHREDYFHAVHASSCGKHLAIMTLSNRVILIQDFRRLLAPSQIGLQDILKQVDFYTERPLLDTEGYLAYDRGKVAVVGPHGIFVLILDSILDQLGGINPPPKVSSLQNFRQTSSERKPSWPNLRLRQARFDIPRTPSGDLVIHNTDMISCLQLTETKLFVSVLSDDWMEEQGGNMWCCDFASSPLFFP